MHVLQIRTAVSVFSPQYLLPAIGQAPPEFSIGFVCSSGGLGVAFFDLIFKEIDGFEHGNHQ
jgi:hypothetical protein